MNGKKLELGFSLLEIMVVFTIFAFLALIATQSIFATLRLSTKSTATSRVRNDIDYALSIMERNLHNASNVGNCDDNVVTYLDVSGNTGTFSCESIGDNGYLASGSGRLTGTDTEITTCEIVCTDASAKVPALINVSISAKDNKKTGSEGSQLTTSTQIYLRSY
ncbi:prepilin-type N-terminal cleavage/methylation domain-containing protein [Candidatus Microgenomates bacterium]|nr:prepilin-type N-terminal cleavage/methylation domain-containing protein [Candidatus Microgenomates bacterium]